MSRVHSCWCAVCAHTDKVTRRWRKTERRKKHILTDLSRSGFLVVGWLADWYFYTLVLTSQQSVSRKCEREMTKTHAQCVCGPHTNTIRENSEHMDYTNVSCLISDLRRENACLSSVRSDERTVITCWYDVGVSSDERVTLLDGRTDGSKMWIKRFPTFPISHFTQQVLEVILRYTFITTVYFFCCLIFKRNLSISCRQH